MYDVPSVAYVMGQTITTKYSLTDVSGLTAHEAKPYLYDHKAGATVVSTLEVDGALIMRDVEALNCSSLLEAYRGSLCEGKRKERGEER